MTDVWPDDEPRWCGAYWPVVAALIVAVVAFAAVGWWLA